MRKILLIVPLLLASLFAGCRSSRHVSTDRTIIVNNDTIIRERLVPVVSPADSARILALMRCDENGKVLLSWYEQECSKNAHLNFRLDSLGRLQADFNVKPDTVYVPTRDSVITSSTDKHITETIEVERKMNALERYLITTSVLLHGFLLGYGIFRLRKLIFFA